MRRTTKRGLVSARTAATNCTPASTPTVASTHSVSLRTPCPNQSFYGRPM